MDFEAEALWPRDRLDPDYAARLTCSDQEFRQIIDDYTRLTTLARTAPEVRQDLPYDRGSAERFDLYGTTPGEARPCFVFIHGGYWRLLSRAESGFMAPMLAARGIACAVPDYTLAPAVSLTEITRQCRALLAHLWHNAGDLGIDRNRIVVGGSSAGGHLAAAVASGGWQGGAGLPDQPLHGLLPVSGLFDLAPLAACQVNDWMRFTPDEIAALSPLRRLPAGPLPAVVALAARETPGFQRQSAAYAAALGAPLLTPAGRNHFDVILDLCDPDTALSRALLGLFACA